MDSKLVILFAASAVLLIGAPGNCLEISKKYLYGPSNNLTADIYPGFDTLSKVQLWGVTKNEQVLGKLKEYPISNLGAVAREDIEWFIELANTDENCPENMAQQFIDEHNSVKISNKIVKKQLLLNFMEHYGALKFDKCAQKALDSIKIRRENNEELADTEKFFRQAVFLDENAPDGDFYEKLSQNSAKDPKSLWNVIRMKPIVYKFTSNDYIYRFLPNEKIAYLFSQKCKVVNQQFRSLLATINLATLLKPGKDYLEGEIKAKNLNEIARICLDIFRDESTFTKNIAEQLMSG